MTHAQSTRVAVAESCSGGLVMAQMVAVPGSGDWFVGGVVAYSAEVKFEVLDVDRGPVVTEAAAAQMATGVRRLLGADIGFSTTGVAGPESEEGQPVGTVFIGRDTRGEVNVSRHQFGGSPDEIRQQVADVIMAELSPRLQLRRS